MSRDLAALIGTLTLTATLTGGAPWAPEPTPPATEPPPAEAVPRADSPADLTQHRPTPPTTLETPPRGEGWRPLLTAHFGPHTDEALAVLECESSGDPDAVNPTSGAAGLFQHLPRYWARRSAAAGLPGADIHDPEANIAVAAWLSSGGTDWSHWTCRP